MSSSTAAATITISSAAIYFAGAVVVPMNGNAAFGVRYCGSVPFHFWIACSCRYSGVSVVACAFCAFAAPCATISAVSASVRAFS